MAPAELPVPAEPPAPTDPGQPTTAEAPPTMGEVERRRIEVRKLEEVGRLLELSPTQQLAQMATEAGLSTLAGEEPARKKLWLTMGGKSPRKEFLKTRQLKRPQRYWLGIEALSEIHWLQKSTELLICKLPFSCLVCRIAQEIGKFGMHLQMHAVLTLQEAAEN